MSDSELTSPAYTGYQLEIFMGCFVPLQVICVALRFYSRSITRSKWGIDDGLVIVSLGFQLAMAGVSVSGVHDGCIGYHAGYLEETQPEKLTLFFKYLVAISSMYFFMVNIPKLAILALFWRLFPTPWIRWTIYVTAGILVGASIANTAADLGACHPFEAQWAAPEVQATQCINKESLFIWSSMPSIVTDLVLLVLPMPVVWKLHATPKMKIALTFTFLVGSFGLVTSILRFNTFFSNNSFIDATFAAVELIIWTETEPGIYLICACLPTYRPILERLGITRMTHGIRTAGKSGRSGEPTAQRGWYGPHSGLGNSKHGITSQGFHELDDRSESETSYGGKHRHETSQTGIMVTTKIQSKWNQNSDPER